MSTDSKETKDITQSHPSTDNTKVSETQASTESKLQETQAKKTTEENKNVPSQLNEVQALEKKTSQDPQKKSSESQEEEQKQGNELENQKSLELKSQKSSQENQTDSNRPKENSQIQQKIEQNLNTAISAMGGFMSGIMNKVQQGGQSTQAQQQTAQMRRHRSEEIAQERELLTQSAQNRKSSVYTQLKEWDNARISALNIHRNILESILGRVDQRMKASQDNITGLCILFKVIVEQIKSSASVHLPHVSNTHIYKSVYGKVYDAAHLFEQQVLEKKEKALAFTEKIESEIIQGTINAEVEHYSATIATIRQNLFNLKRSLHEQQQKLQRKSQKVKDVYQSNSDTSKKAKKDFQKSLYSFLYACQDFKDFQVILAKATVGFWKKAVELEKHRSKVIHQAITSFNQLHTDHIVKQGLPSYFTEEMQQILASQEVDDEYISQHMDFNCIVQPEDQIYIATQLKKPKKTVLSKQASGNQESVDQSVYDISIQEVYHFLIKVSFPSFEDNNLAHKKMHAQREFPKNQFKNTTIVITPDSFLLCYDDVIPNNTSQSEEKSQEQANKDQKNEEVPKQKNSQEIQEDGQNQRAFYLRKPDFQMQIQQITLKKNGQTLDLKSQSKSTFMQLIRPSNEIKFLFKTLDQMEEFIQIIQALEEKSD